MQAGIDYYAYGGEASSELQRPGLCAYLSESRKEKGVQPPVREGLDYAKDAWRNRDTWSNIADHLGIKKVDSPTDLRQMYDYVQGIEEKRRRRRQARIQTHSSPRRSLCRWSERHHRNGMPNLVTLATESFPAVSNTIPPLTIQNLQGGKRHRKCC